MKRGWAVLLCACLLCVLGAAAAERADLLDVFQAEEESMSWLGTAIPIGDGTLLASGAVMEGAEEVTVTDGFSPWDASAWISGDGAVAFILYDEEETPSQRDIYPLISPDMRIAADQLTLRTGDELGSRINRRVLSLQEYDWYGHEAFLAELSGPVELGAAALTEGNELAGMVIASFAEGENRYVLLSATAMAEYIAEAAEEINGTPEMPEPEGFAVTVEDGNLVSFDWSGMTLEMEEGERAYLQVMDTANSFFTFFPLAEAECPIRMLLVPGHTYISGVAVTREAPSGVLDAYVVTELPEAEPLTEHGFTSQICSLALAPAEGLADGAEPTPVDRVTPEELKAGRVYFYSQSSYTVEESISDLSLLVTLTTPDGDTYTYVSGWIYEPAYMDRDVWFVSLENMGFLQVLRSDLFREGEYEISFYVGGKLGDRFTFTIGQEVTDL